MAVGERSIAAGRGGQVAAAEGGSAAATGGGRASVSSADKGRLRQRVAALIFIVVGLAAAALAAFGVIDIALAALIVAVDGGVCLAGYRLWKGV